LSDSGTDTTPTPMPADGVTSGGAETTSRGITTEAADMTVLPLSKEQVAERVQALAQPEPGLGGATVSAAEDVAVGDAQQPSVGGFVHAADTTSDTVATDSGTSDEETPTVSGGGSSSDV
jgi:hypothetical protein